MPQVNLEMRPELLQRLDNYRKKQGLTRSEVIRAAVLEKLEGVTRNG